MNLLYNELYDLLYDILLYDEMNSFLVKSNKLFSQITPY
jgi:hypothetical protein